jgi:hypothetical protein
MSTTFAFADDGGGVLAAGPSTARAFLHALALKLHRLASATKEATSKVLNGLKTVPRLIIDTILTTVATVRSRSGFGAAVRLIGAGSQVVAYAMTALAIRASGLSRLAVVKVRQAVKSLPRPQVPSDLTARALAHSKNPWVAGFVVVFAVVAAGAVALWRWTAGRADSRVSDVLALSEEERERIMKGLFVVLGADGSLRVHGIPVTVSDHTRDGVARVAVDAATQRLHSLVSRGRPLSTIDLQAVNVAARSAVQRAFAEVADAA